MKHGIYVSNEQTTSAPFTAASGIPFVIGAAPIQTAAHPAAVGVPTKCANMEEFKDKFGYSEDWEKYNLCEFAYAFFTLYGCGPVVFCNLLAPSTMKEAVAAADIAVTASQIKLPYEAIASSVVVKAEGGQGDTYVLDTDYSLSYDQTSEKLIITVIDDGAADAATELNVAYDKATPATSVNAAAVATGLENLELCMASAGCIPDLICAPGFSTEATVAAAMALKAAGINGMFRAKALVDIAGETASAAITAKGETSDENVILCWPLVKNGTKTYHLSTHLAGVMARTDSGNNGCPYESPSNKELVCDSIVLSTGAALLHGVSDANTLGAHGIVTVLSFCGRLVVWGNYTSVYPGNATVEKAFICHSRVADYIGNTLIRTAWARLDSPITRRFIDSIVDQVNIWLNGLKSESFFYGAKVEATEADNPTASLMQGIVTFSIDYASPSPAQQINFKVRYSANYATAALS